MLLPEVEVAAGDLTTMHLGHRVRFTVKGTSVIESVLTRVAHEKSYKGEPQVMLSLSDDGWNWSGHVSADTYVTVFIPDFEGE